LSSHFPLPSLPLSRTLSLSLSLSIWISSSSPPTPLPPPPLAGDRVLLALTAGDRVLLVLAHRAESVSAALMVVHLRHATPPLQTCLPARRWPNPPRTSPIRAASPVAGPTLPPVAVTIDDSPLSARLHSGKGFPLILASCTCLLQGFGQVSLRQCS
ncbi:unnamed protein product, partial [Urochloa humidicola]